VHAELSATVAHPAAHVKRVGQVALAFTLAARHEHIAITAPLQPYKRAAVRIVLDGIQTNLAADHIHRNGAFPKPVRLFDLRLHFHHPCLLRKKNTRRSKDAESFDQPCA